MLIGLEYSLVLIPTLHSLQNICHIPTFGRRHLSPSPRKWASWTSVWRLSRSLKRRCIGGIVARTGMAKVLCSVHYHQNGVDPHHYHQVTSPLILRQGVSILYGLQNTLVQTSLEETYLLGNPRQAVPWWIPLCFESSLMAQSHFHFWYHGAKA